MRVFANFSEFEIVIHNGVRVRFKRDKHKTVKRQSSAATTGRSAVINVYLEDQSRIGAQVQKKRDSACFCYKMIAHTPQRSGTYCTMLVHTAQQSSILVKHLTVVASAKLSNYSTHVNNAIAY